MPTAEGISYMVSSVCDQNTGFDSANPDNVATLPISLDGQWITFTLSNGIIATLRTSGTEPKLKYYVEYCGKPGENRYSLICKRRIIKAEMSRHLDIHRIISFLLNLLYRSRDAVKALLKSIVGGIIAEFIQPEENNLILKQ